MEGLPLLPGYTFHNPTRFKHHVPQHFLWKNGYPVPKRPEVGIGGEPLDVHSVLYISSLDSTRFDPSLTYGRSKSFVPPVFKPHFVLYDKKCLSFQAFFKQSIYDSPTENYRIRRVNIIYFLEDDTITVMEPPVPDAGFPQGRLVTRNKIPKDNQGALWYWKDLNVGIDMAMFGVVYHLCSCDLYTREYLTSQGIEVKSNENIPVDPYFQQREQSKMLKNFSTPNIYDKVRQFLEYDNQVLRFYALWDSGIDGSELKPYVIRYFLSDDTIEISDDSNKSVDCPFRLLLKRIKIPKKWNEFSKNDPVYLENGKISDDEFYQPPDFILGNTVFVFGRRFFLYDCDNFTRQYYRDTMKIEQGNRIETNQEEKKPIPQRPLPPYLGLGSIEDSLGSFYHFNPKPPKVDVIRYLHNMSKRLRYTAKMDWINPADSLREFVIEYRLSDGKIMVHEYPLRNSGFKGGIFLKYTLLPKPGTNKDNPEYYTPEDFNIESQINVFGHRFIITGADLAVYRYMEANPEKFTKKQLCDVRKSLISEGYLDEDIKDVAEFRKREEIEEPVIENPEV